MKVDNSGETGAENQQQHHQQPQQVGTMVVFVYFIDVSSGSRADRSLT